VAARAGDRGRRQSLEEAQRHGSAIGLRQLAHGASEQLVHTQPLGRTRLDGAVGDARGDQLADLAFATPTHGLQREPPRDTGEPAARRHRGIVGCLGAEADDERVLRDVRREMLVAHQPTREPVQPCGFLHEGRGRDRQFGCHRDASVPGVISVTRNCAAATDRQAGAATLRC
jgi:hypothetical protein